jgi:6-pyruvoyltetrahydropterin/6-carboxytetrahydropterin synthase
LYRISKKFEFSAAHALTNLPPEHQCSRIHGHNYVVDLILESSTLDSRGFVRDYGELDDFKRYVNNVLDHRWLGYGSIMTSWGHPIAPVFDFSPTAENIANRLFEIVGAMGYEQCTMVGVSETPKTWAWSTPLSLTYENLEDALMTLPDDAARRRFVEAFKGPQ